MIEPDNPTDEAQRIEALRRLAVLDTAPEERFDRLTRLARRLFGVPIALVSLVDSDRQWFKSRAGIDATETGRDISFCGHAILGERIFCIPDASEDERFQDNPLVTGEPGIRFYAGCPLRSPGGQRVGTLCLIDRRPRTLAVNEWELLEDLGMMAERELAVDESTTMDSTTQLSNRRGFLALASQALSTCDDHDGAARLVVFELDTAGNGPPAPTALPATTRHAVTFASLLRDALPAADVLGRLGPETFVALVSGPAATQLRATLDRLAVAATAHAHLRFGITQVRYDRLRHASLRALLAEAENGDRVTPDPHGAFGEAA